MTDEEKINRKRQELFHYQSMARVKTQEAGEMTRKCQQLEKELNELYSKEAKSQKTPPQVS